LPLIREIDIRILDLVKESDVANILEQMQTFITHNIVLETGQVIDIQFDDLRTTEVVINSMYDTNLESVTVGTTPVIGQDGEIKIRDIRQEYSEFTPKGWWRNGSVFEAVLDRIINGAKEYTDDIDEEHVPFDEDEDNDDAGKKRRKVDEEGFSISDSEDWNGDPDPDENKESEMDLSD